MVDCGDDIRNSSTYRLLQSSLHRQCRNVLRSRKPISDLRSANDHPDIYEVNREIERPEITYRSPLILDIKSETKVNPSEESQTPIGTTMGIVSSTFASLAFQLAWNCQRLLDPQYRCLEGQRASEIENPEPVKPGHPECEKRNSSSSSNSKSSESRARRTLARQRYRKRPASFDTALIVNYSANQPVVHVNAVATSTPTPTPSPLGRPRPQYWDVTSSSGCSSDSGSYLDSDSEVDRRLNEAFIKKCDECSEDEKDSFAMSAEEEAALRMTVGRGHFSRSKKDRFLNHLRLEKRLNGLSNTFCGAGGSQRGHGRYPGRRYSGDLYRVTY